MYTSLIVLQYNELNTILPQIDKLAKIHNLSRADIIRNVLYQYFGYQIPERPSKQEEQEHNIEISLQLTLHNKYIPVFLDIDFQSKYLGTNSFRRMTTAVNILNKFFNYGVPLKYFSRKAIRIYTQSANCCEF